MSSDRSAKGAAMSMTSAKLVREVSRSRNNRGVVTEALLEAITR
jgi:hypothetical protein